MQRYQRVTYEVRCQIYAHLKTKIAISEIAKLTGYHRSTIYREIHRHGGVSYNPSVAQKSAKKSFKKCRRKTKLDNYDLRQIVYSAIKGGWSPEQVCGRMRRQGQKPPSRQAIYNAIHKDYWEWKSFLRKKNKPPGGRNRLRQTKKRPDWMKSIHARPENINNRSEFGHWERDGMFGKDRRQLIVFVERKSRYVKFFKAKDPYSVHLNLQMKDFINQFDTKILSLTNDNGNEFLDGFRYDIPVYYCDPRSPYQKGSVENAIGLLRQYLPKKVDLETLSEETLRAFESKLNNRPRKCLDYKTPYEVLFGENVALAS